MNNDIIKELVVEFTDDLYKWAYYKTSSTETAEDLVQDTFLAAAEKIDSFKGDSSHKTWLFSILNFKIIDYYRKRVKEPANIGTDYLSNYFTDDGDWKEGKKPKEWHEEENHLLDDAEFQKILQICLDALPVQWSICVKLKYLSEKKGSEICQEVGIATTNYWQIIHRAKLQLRNCIEHKWFKN